jgi:hypothetical protein
MGAPGPGCGDDCTAGRNPRRVCRSRRPG